MPMLPLQKPNFLRAPLARKAGPSTFYVVSGTPRRAGVWNAVFRAEISSRVADVKAVGAVLAYAMIAQDFAALTKAKWLQHDRSTRPRGDQIYALFQPDPLSGSRLPSLPRAVSARGIHGREACVT